MYYRRFLPSILRSSSRRSACPILSAPSLFSTRGSGASASGYLLNRTSEYATTSVKDPPSGSTKYYGKKLCDRRIVDLFLWKRDAGEVCRLNGSIIDVRFEEGLPEIGTKLKALYPADDADDAEDSNIRAGANRMVANHLGKSYVRACIRADPDLVVVDHLGGSIVRASWEDGSVERTEGLVIGQRVLKTGLPISQSTLKHSDKSDDRRPSDEWEEEAARDELAQELVDLEQEGVAQDLIPELKRVYVKARRYLLENRLLQNNFFKRWEVLPVPDNVFFGRSTLRNGSIGTVCWLDGGGGDMVDIRFPNKLWFGTTHLEVLPATLDVFPDPPMVLKVWDIVYPSGDESVVRATAWKGTEGFVVGEKVFGFPMYNPLWGEISNEMPELSELKEEVEEIRDEIRFMFEEQKDEEEDGKNEA